MPTTKYFSISVDRDDSTRTPPREIQQFHLDKATDTDITAIKQEITAIYTKWKKKIDKRS